MNFISWFLCKYWSDFYAWSPHFTKHCVKKTVYHNCVPTLQSPVGYYFSTIEHHSTNLVPGLNLHLKTQEESSFPSSFQLLAKLSYLLRTPISQKLLWFSLYVVFSTFKTAKVVQIPLVLWISLMSCSTVREKCFLSAHVIRINLFTYWGQLIK